MAIILLKLKAPHTQVQGFNLAMKNSFAYSRQKKNFTYSRNYIALNMPNRLCFRFSVICAINIIKIWFKMNHFGRFIFRFEN